MGPLFTRMATVWLERQKSDKFKSTMNKRKRTDHDDKSNKRKMIIYRKIKNDSDDDDDERLILSPRIPPIISKANKSSNRSFSSLTLFRCQLCRRYLKNKDIYMEHMMVCAVQRQASIKIVRAVKDKDALAVP